MKLLLAPLYLFLSLQSIFSLNTELRADSENLPDIRQSQHLEVVSQGVEKLPVSISEKQRVIHKLMGDWLGNEGKEDKIGEVEDSISFPKSPSSSDEEINWASILNMGKQAWAMIEANRPVVNTKYDYANALPSGVLSGTDLENFSQLHFHAYRVWGKNIFGATVYDVTYTVVFRQGGSLEGRGMYIDSLTVVPQKINVLWGYTVSFDVSKVSVSNVGTHASPVASAVLEAILTIKTVVQHIENRYIFEVRGDRKEIHESKANL